MSLKPTFRDHDLRAALSRLMQQHGDAAVINAALALRELHDLEQARALQLAVAAKSDALGKEASSC